MLDLACSTFLIALTLAVATAYGVRVAIQGRVTSPRIEREGRSALLGRGAMETFHWALEPVGRACIRVGLTANAVTFGSVAVAVFAGVAVAVGHPGAGALLAAVSASGDGLDGLIARRTATASDAGEVIDSAADRYSELVFLGGITLALRESAPLLLLSLFAILASFMVSYSTAKAQALRLPVPRGSMRRTERAVYLTFGAALVPLAGLLDPRWGPAPIVAALFLVAAVGNVSALQRLAAIAGAARARSRTSESPIDGSGTRAERPAE